MTSLTVHCTRCHTQVDSGIELSAGSQLTMDGNSVKCPEDGEVIAVPDGVYTANAFGQVLFEPS